MSLPPLLLVGGGRMGAALLKGWQARGVSACVVVDPSPGAAALAGGDVTVLSAAGEIAADFRPAAVIFAVKPQAAAAVLPEYARFAGAVFVSIMAGTTLTALGRLLGPGCDIVRAMPNTPAAVGQGFTVAVAGLGVPPAQRALADALLAATGALEWVDDEALLDPVTAISGGGPAYLFYLTELMERAALAHGIAPALARAMARRTIIGAAALLAASDEDATVLRAAVTSKQGTTEAALAVLTEIWPDAFADAITSATKRSRTLSV
jgi:pyrroline-5-carboxylate reductase